MESCPECGADVRLRCSQGHASGAGERFCEICGEFLPLVQPGQPVAVGVAAPNLEYSSGSFTDFIASSDDDYASLAVPVLPEEPWEPEPEPVVLEYRPAEVDPEPEFAEPEPAALEPSPVESAFWEPEPGPEPVALAPGPVEPSLWDPVTREPSPARAEPVLDFAEPVAWEAEPAGPGPQVGEGPSPTGSTLPFDLSLTFPSSPARPTPGTWRSSAKPKDRPGPDGGVHHDVTPRMPGANELATPVPAAQRPRRARVIVVVALVAVFGAGGTAGALALHRHYAAGITSPARHVAEANPASSAGPARPGASSASRGSAPATPSPAQSVGSSGWSSPFPVTPLHGGVAVNGMSCPTPTVCYAVDSTGAILSSTPPGGWLKVDTDSASGLVAISCAKKQSCVAVDHSGNALTLANGTWSSPSIVDTGSGSFTGLSCSNGAFCMAIDSSGAAYADTPAGWQQFTVDTVGSLTGVSCTSTKNCVAVDNGGGVYTYDGASWSAVSAIDVGHAFTAVSCSDKSFCAAVDHSGNAAVLTSGKWNVTSLGTIAATIACPATGFCVATNSKGGTVLYRNGTWSHVSKVDGNAAIVSLSCASATFCVAIDNQGQALYYRPE